MSAEEQERYEIEALEANMRYIMERYIRDEGAQPQALRIPIRRSEMSAFERIEEGEVYDDWGHPPDELNERVTCVSCGADYDLQWAGTTCSLCDGDIAKPSQSDRK